MNDTKPLALSVEAVRHEMLRGILIPRDIVNKAIRTTVEKLDAKETKFFSYKGVVVSERQVDDHGSQLAAADQIFSLAGLYAREREAAPQMPSFEITVSPNGVVKLSTGSPAIQALPPQGDPVADREPVESTIIEARAADITQLDPRGMGESLHRHPTHIEPLISYDEEVE